MEVLKVCYITENTKHNDWKINKDNYIEDSALKEIRTTLRLKIFQAENNLTEEELTLEKLRESAKTSN